MKRRLAILLALALLASLLPAALAATSPYAEHTHSWHERRRTAPTCTKNGSVTYTCSCGQTKTETLKKTGHSWGKWKTTKAATCVSGGQEMRKCKACGKTETRKTGSAGHSWGKWKTTKEATCVSNGEQTRKCSVCGKTETRKTDKAAHKWGAWNVTLAATCTATGTRERKCSVCGQKQTDTVAMIPHSWGEWEDILPATDHSSGTRRHVCQVCGAEETEDYDPEGTVRRGDKGDPVRQLQEGLICYGVLTGRADGNFGPGTERAVMAAQEAEGLVADGVAWPQTLARLGHRFGEWETISELSDFSVGIRQRVCVRCGYTEKEETWPEPTYRRGDKGEGVRGLQEGLNAAGYDCGKADGDFGGRTERAVRAIEEAHGVEADGIAWPGVQKWLGGGAADEPDDGAEDEPGIAPGGPFDAAMASSTNKNYSNPPVGDQPLGEVLAGALPTLRSLVIVEQTKVEDDYYDGAEIPVKMCLTIDDMDEYDLWGIVTAPGDSVSDEGWMHGALQSGQSYDFTYTMVLDKQKSGWTTRTVRAWLYSHDRGLYEYEDCEVSPPFTYATVTIGGGDSHVINDNAAYLYLDLNSAYNGSAFAGELMELPFLVDSDGNTVIRDVKLVCDQMFNGDSYFQNTFDIVDRMNCGTRMDQLKRLYVRSAPGSANGGTYRLKMYLTGWYYDRKGRKQVVESLPIYPHLNVMQQGKTTRLSISYTLEPDKAAYALNDLVDIRFTVSNSGTEAVQNVSVGLDSQYVALKSIVGDRQLVNGGAAMEPGETGTVTFQYRIQPGDMTKESVEAAFFASCVGVETGAGERSLKAYVALPVAQQKLDEGITLSATLTSPGGEYLTGVGIPCRLRVENGTDRAIKKLRIYATGDNRDEYMLQNASWHDFSHGLKGPECVAGEGIAPSGGEDYDVEILIPSEFRSNKVFRPAWTAEAEMDDGEMVYTNTASLSLPIVQESLWLNATISNQDIDVYEPGMEVVVSILLNYTGKHMPKSFIVYARQPGFPGREEARIEEVYGKTARGTITLPLGPDRLKDGAWHYAIVAAGVRTGTLSSNTYELTIPAAQFETGTDAPVDGEDEEPEEPGAPIYGDLLLFLEQQTENDNPNGWWLNGDKVKVKATAVYVGEETPKRISVDVTDAVQTEAPLWLKDVYDSSTFMDEFEITLDGTHAVDGSCAYTFTAWGHMESLEVADVGPVSMTMVFDMAPAAGGPDAMPSEGQGGMSTYSTWAASSAAGKASKAAQSGGGAEAAQGGEAAGESPAPASGAVPAEAATAADTTNNGEKATPETATAADSSGNDEKATAETATAADTTNNSEKATPETATTADSTGNGVEATTETATAVDSTGNGEKATTEAATAADSTGNSGKATTETATVADSTGNGGEATPETATVADSTGNSGEATPETATVADSTGNSEKTAPETTTTADPTENGGEATVDDVPAPGGGAAFPGGESAPDAGDEVAAGAAQGGGTDARETGLIRCVYSETGGMENVRHIYTLAAGAQPGSLAVTAENGDDTAIYPASDDALTRLSTLMAAYHPETWAELPPSEIVALDAPSERLTLTFADGTECDLTDDREGAAEILRLARCFLESYTVTDARTFRLTFPSDGGGEPEYIALLSAPEAVWISSVRTYDEADPNGGYSDALVFHGRLPGRTELILIREPGARDGGEAGRTTYVLEVDDDYGVVCVEQTTE